MHCKCAVIMSACKLWGASVCTFRKMENSFSTSALQRSHHCHCCHQGKMDDPQWCLHGQPRGQDYLQKHKLDSKQQSQTHRAKQYKVTSFLSTDCELSTETCSKNVYTYSPGLHNKLLKPLAQGASRFEKLLARKNRRTQIHHTLAYQIKT